MPPLIFRKAWRLGPDIDTDQLASGAYMTLGLDAMKPHCLEMLRKDFASGVLPGDLIVAGPGFGIGSSREQAVTVLLELGVAAVVSPRFGGLFLRNGFNVGLLLVTCPRAEEIADHERIDVDFDSNEVVRPNGARLPCEPIPQFLRDMVEAGGLFNVLKRRFAGGSVLLSGSTPPSK